MWWLSSGVFWLQDKVDITPKIHSPMLFISLTALACCLIAYRTCWSELAKPWRLMPFLIPVYLIGHFNGSFYDAPLQGWGVLSWITVIGVNMLALKLYESSWPEQLVKGHHLALCWTLQLILALEVLSWFYPFASLEEALFWSVMAIALPCLILLLAAAKPLWPFVTFSRYYFGFGPLPIIGLAFALFAVGIEYPGIPLTETYWPLLSWADLAQLTALVLLTGWQYCQPAREFCRYTLLSYGVSSTVPALAIATAWLLFLSLILIRVCHHWYGVGWNITSIKGSELIQAGLSIFWCIAALGVMILSQLNRRRVFWLSGAVLLAVVVLKLFSVDLAGSGTLARLVSFIVVGGLMLMIGYFSPLPPRQASEPGHKSNVMN